MIGLFYASEQCPNPKTPVYLLESILQFQYINHIDEKDNSVRYTSNVQHYGLERKSVMWHSVLGNRNFVQDQQIKSNET